MPGRFRNRTPVNAFRTAASSIAYGFPRWNSTTLRSCQNEYGERGRPEVCRARCSSVISVPSRLGTLVSGGSSSRNGVVNRTVPSSTSTARVNAVMVLVIDPISKRLSGAIPLPRTSTATWSVCRSTIPAATPTCRRISRSAITASPEG